MILKEPFFNKENSITITNNLLLELIKESLAKDIDFSFQATGSSMYPFIRDNDTITVSSLKRIRLVTGDVVAFVKDNNNLIVHRIIGQKGNSYITKGDNCSASDGFIEITNILGKIIAVKRNNKNIKLGLGPEKLFISFFINKFPKPVLSIFWKLIPSFIKHY
jgi:signal peptidase